MRKRADALEEYVNLLESVLEKCRREHGGVLDNGQSYLQFRPIDAEGVILPDEVEMDVEYEDNNGDESSFSQELCVPTRNLKVHYLAVVRAPLLTNCSSRRGIYFSMAILPSSALHLRPPPPCPQAPVSLAQTMAHDTHSSTASRSTAITQTLTGPGSCPLPSPSIEKNTTSTSSSSLTLPS